MKGTAFSLRKKYAGNITQAGRSNEPNPLYMWLPDQGSNLGPAD